MKWVNFDMEQLTDVLKKWDLFSVSKGLKNTVSIVTVCLVFQDFNEYSAYTEDYDDFM